MCKNTVTSFLNEVTSRTPTFTDIPTLSGLGIRAQILVSESVLALGLRGSTLRRAVGNQVAVRRPPSSPRHLALGAADGRGALRSPFTRRPGPGGSGRPLATFKSEAGSSNSASITLGWQGFVPEVRGESRWTINYERPPVRAQT